MCQVARRIARDWEHREGPESFFRNKSNWSCRPMVAFEKARKRRGEFPGARAAPFVCAPRPEPFVAQSGTGYGRLWLSAVLG